MTGLLGQPLRLAGTLITLDGPGGVGKSTTARLVIDTLVAAGLPVHGTTQPSRAPLGELARHGTDTFRGMALACLCAADRDLQARGWPVVTLDCTTETSDTIAARIVSLIHRVLMEKSPACR